jgi:hypothetical protein
MVVILDTFDDLGIKYSPLETASGDLIVSLPCLGERVQVTADEALTWDYHVLETAPYETFVPSCSQREREIVVWQRRP